MQFNERELNTLVNNIVSEQAGKQNRELERVRQQYVGRPVNEVKLAIKQSLRGSAIQVADSQIDEWAEMISEGGRVTFVPQPLK